MIRTLVRNLMRLLVTYVHYEHLLREVWYES